MRAVSGKSERNFKKLMSKGKKLSCINDLCLNEAKENAR